MCVHQLQPQRLGQRAEQRGPVADRHWVDHQPVFIDQSIVDQRVDEGCAAVGEDHTAGFALEPVDVLGQVAVGDPALCPVGGGQRGEKTTFGMSFMGAAYTLSS